MMTPTTAATITVMAIANGWFTVTTSFNIPLLMYKYVRQIFSCEIYGFHIYSSI